MASTSNAIYLFEALAISNDSGANEWILHLGCSFHICPHKNWFKNSKDCQLVTMYMGNNHTCHVIRVGDVFFKLKNGKVRLLIDVHYVLSLKRNMITLGT